MDPDNITSISKSYGHYAITDTANAVKSIFLCAMADILDYHTVGIKESVLSQRKRDIVFHLISLVFLLIPFKTDFLINILYYKYG